MENIKASTLKTKDEVISDLEELLALINDGKEGYRSAAEATDNSDLQDLFAKFSGERMMNISRIMRTTPITCRC